MSSCVREPGSLPTSISSSVGPCVGQQARVSQPVVGDDVGGLNQPQSL